MSNQLTMGSLFAGIGGFEEAARREGIKTLWNCEIDPFKRQILKKNFPDVHQYGDINELRHPERVDILTGGFPCQDISVANTSFKKGKGVSGERSGLWKEYARILGEIRPNVVVFENSSMLLVRGLELVLCDFSRTGYHVEWRCFSAFEFGYPHIRKRIYGVAYAMQSGWESHLAVGGLLSKVHFQKSKIARQAIVSLPPERFRRDSDYSSVRMVDGFRSRLDKRRIHGCGNAVVVDIPQAIFKVLLSHWPKSL